VKKISDSDDKQKLDVPWVFTVLGLFICLGGGILSISSLAQIRSAGFSGALYNFALFVVPILFGIITIIGALIGLWLQRAGPILSLSVGLVSLVACQGINWTGMIPCITFSPIYLSGSLLTITGSVIGLIGGILKQKKVKKG
jgi:hypothetical protein